MDTLLSKKTLLLVSGKGGVGKTAVSSALAYRALQRGRKVLLFCCDAPSFLKPYPQGRVLSSTLQEIMPGLWGVNQPTEEAVHAYLSEAIHSKKVVDLMFRNKVARAFLQVAPSVGDLAMMGRIYQIARQFEAKH
jgi:anion-transporting  ArsA/GET3 family ATPase